MRMPTISAIIANHGGLNALSQQIIRVENPPYMPLVIEFAGHGPRGHILVSVAHTFVQNGDVVYDPEMEFEITADGEWHPISWQQGDSRHEAVWVTCGQVQVAPRILRELEQFAKMWDKNLRVQGFIKPKERNHAVHVSTIRPRTARLAVSP